VDNNATERCVKPFALGRRNWLFAGNVKGAEAGANLYSLIETCKSHNLNPYNYMKDILEKLAKPKPDLTTLVSLLPYNWKPTESEA
jgi:transposase